MRSISIFHLGSSWFDPTFFSEDPHTSISHQRSGQLLQRRVTHHPHPHQKHPIREKTSTHTPPLFLLPFVPGSSIPGILLLHFWPPSHPRLCFPPQGQDQGRAQTIRRYQSLSEDWRTTERDSKVGVPEISQRQTDAHQAEGGETFSVVQCTLQTQSGQTFPGLCPLVPSQC